MAIKIGNLKTNYKNPVVRSTGLIIIIWFLAISSILGFHYYFKQKPRINRDQIKKIREKYASLNDEQKIRLKYLECGILELASGEVYFLEGNSGDNRMNQASGSRLAYRKIEFSIEDPLLLERQMMFKEALKTLNNAEKHCFSDRHAAIISNDGKYYLAVDAEIYADYVKKYGTKCRSCENAKAVSIKNINKRRTDK